jgi:type II secretory pathway component PulF
MTAPPLSWNYSAETPAGEIVSGRLEAPDERSALSVLQSRRLTPLTLEPARSAPRSGASSFANGNSLSLSDLAAIARRMSDLLGAGLPLLKTLELAGDQAANKRQRFFFAHLGAEIRAGRTLSAALANGDIRAPSFMQALARTGESIGALPAQFSVLADHYERTLKTRREITAQLVYPAALTVLILLTLIFLSFFVLPQFETIFQNASAAPPPETRLALAGGAFIRANLVYAPVAALLAAVGWRFARARYRSQIERMLLAAPFIGRLRRDHELGRYCRSLATMLSGGMALADAMPLAADAVQLDSIKAELAQTEAAVRAGDRLSAALKHFAAPPKEITSFLDVGDETGTLAGMAGQAARFAEERSSASVKRFMALLSPVLTSIMGLVTAGVIAAVMSGVLSLNDAVY